MRTLIFGETPEIAQQFADYKRNLSKLNLAEVVTSQFDIPEGWDLSVYLVGDWEANSNWQGVLSELRRVANKCVVKVFVASEMV